MCLSIKTNSEILTRDITVYKALIVLDDGVIVSPFNQFVYEKDIKYTTRITTDGILGIKGFHSNKTSMYTLHDLGILENYCRRNISDFKEVRLAEFIIPKGSEVYKGYWRETLNEIDYEGYISNQIIFKKLI